MDICVSSNGIAEWKLYISEITIIDNCSRRKNY